MVLEMGDEPGAAIKRWQHVRLFSTWRDNIDEAAKASSARARVAVTYRLSPTQGNRSVRTRTLTPACHSQCELRGFTLETSANRSPARAQLLIRRVEVLTDGQWQEVDAGLGLVSGSDIDGTDPSLVALNKPWNEVDWRYGAPRLPTSGSRRSFPGPLRISSET